MSKTKEKTKEMARKMKSNMGVTEKDDAPENESVKYNPKKDSKNMGEDRKEKKYKLPAGGEKVR